MNAEIACTLVCAGFKGEDMRYKPWSDDDLERLKELYCLHCPYSDCIAPLGKD